MNAEQVSEQNSKASWSKWGLLWTTLREKLAKSFTHPELILYWFFIVIVLGANGVWLSIGFEQGKCRVEHRTIILSLCSYFIAVLASSSADLILAKPDYDPETATMDEIVKKNQAKKMIAMLGISVLITGLALTLLSIYSSEGLGYILSLVGVIITLVVWLIANAENPMTKDEPVSNPVSQLGGISTAGPAVISHDPPMQEMDDDDLKNYKH